ncbi:MAG TPA: hypothetical protein DFS52_11370 [Myxococcales bacterium]|jgi:UDP:flavonoid glycosyltransferase YjiC (YdhE family)|nr:hypothetical protein [Myxococcales bacterium]
MRIGIAGWGSEGDLRPLVALAGRLRRAGHEPSLLLSPVDEIDWGATCSALQVPMRLVPELTEHSLQEICKASQSADPSKVSRALLDLAFFPQLEAMYAAAHELCAQSEVVVGLFSSWYLKAACLATGVPFVCVHYYPGMVPSRTVPPIGFPAWKWLNPVAWELFSRVIDLGFGSATKQFFASKGLPKVRRALTDVLLSDRLNLIGASPTLFPAPADWGGLNVVCGDFVLPGEEQPWEPEPALARFLEDGEKPVLFSFGTMAHLAPERSRELVLGAIKQAKVRAVVQMRSAQESGREGDTFFVHWAPHRHLAPRCSAMVIHGGAGTTHAALRAGLPAVVLPFIFEQKLWGRLLHRAGTATRPMSFWKATPQTLGSQIRQALGSEALRQRAAELASRVSREDGTGVAVERLEALAKR